ncbi:hypothetical protein N7505_001345 [Penicillium chrysogenum]|uniref:Uncharacterized protein n=1 Tax=Penicillium chrysogenum TaxID=5076 RepID=A0ABQ8WWE0_PENCH|nr:hypothetical protein N7505_001345 [Penicillium chrysogenum]
MPQISDAYHSSLYGGDIPDLNFLSSDRRKLFVYTDMANDDFMKWWLQIERRRGYVGTHRGFNPTYGSILSKSLPVATVHQK